jgi:hypothetical protein
MPNIKFNYLYRDGANYKKYSNVIFSNHNNIDISLLETLIKSKLIDETWFYADEWQLPELFLATWHHRLDPTWHEFECVEYTDEPAGELLFIEAFIALVAKTNWKY